MTVDDTESKQRSKLIVTSTKTGGYHNLSGKLTLNLKPQPKWEVTNNTNTTEKTIRFYKNSRRYIWKDVILVPAGNRITNLKRRRMNHPRDAISENLCAKPTY